MKKVLVLGATGAMGRYIVPQLAEMGHSVARLVLNDRAVGEAFTVATAEHHSWGEMAELYASLRGLKAVWAPEEDFLRILDPRPWSPYPAWQLRTDRLFNRIIDNSKVLAATGLTQGDLIPLANGLETELAKVPHGYEWSGNVEAGQRMDAWLAKTGKNGR